MSPGTLWLTGCLSPAKGQSTIANTRVRRFAAVGAFAVAAAAVPALALLADTGAQTSTATGKCLAWSGSMTDGQCIAYSNGNGINVGSPGVGFGGATTTEHPVVSG